MRKTCQQLIAVVITFIFVLSCGQIPVFSASAAWDGSVANSFEGGTGTQNDPYIIKTAAQLAYLAQNVNEGESYEGEYFKLVEDITLNSSDMFAYDENGIITGVAEGKTPYEWTPIGNWPSKSFSGVFDGNGHRVIGIYIPFNGDSYRALFGACSNATVKNLGVANGYVVGFDRVGGVIGYLCADYGDATVIDCYNSSVIIGEDNTGGVVGYSVCESGTITVSSCYNTGYMESYGGSIGGVVGKSTLYKGIVSITDCYNLGDVKGGSYTGGIVGYNNTGSDSRVVISNCYNKGGINDGGDTGGIVGITVSYGAVDISNCYNSGDVYGYNVGGVVGYTLNSGAATIAECYNTGVVTSTSGEYAGGVVGRSDETTISNCYNTGNVSGYSGGGITGYNHFGEVSGCYNTGDINGEEVGGIAGANRGAISGCYNIGSVIGESYNAGGIAGYSINAPISNCYSTGNISARNGDAGGIVGTCSHNGSISNCYNTGNVSVRDGDVGGVVGCMLTDDESPVTVKNCYYLSGVAVDAFGSMGNGALTIESVTELTVLQMCEAANFIGFDYVYVWTMEGNPDYPYPELIGMEYGGEIANCEHVPGDWIISTAATCTDHGIKYRECTVCGVVLDIENIPMLGHDWGEWVQTIPPTESEEGEETRVCKNDPSHIETRAIPRLGLKKGDPDGDGEITVADALTALRVAAKLAEETPFLISVCDIDNDGKITVSDALAILRVAAKLTDIL